MMIRKIIWVLACCTGQHAYAQEVDLKYVNLDQEDFSFSEEWSYPESVFVNQYGQLSCDGLCPSEIDHMKINGKIIEDSLSRFYELVDTTHQMHTLQLEGTGYEFDGSDYMSAVRKSDGTIVMESGTSIATHTYIHIELKKNKVKAWLVLNSITNQPGTLVNFNPIGDSYIYIDRAFLKKNILRAKFDMEFDNFIDEDLKLLWKGLVNSPIVNE